MQIQGQQQNTDEGNCTADKHGPGRTLFKEQPDRKGNKENAGGCEQGVHGRRATADAFSLKGVAQKEDQADQKTSAPACFAEPAKLFAKKGNKDKSGDQKARQHHKG